MQIFYIIDFRVSHAFRECNSCDNKLTILSMKNTIEFVWYYTFPNYIKLYYFHNKFQLLLFHFFHF